MPPTPNRLRQPQPMPVLFEIFLALAALLAVQSTVSLLDGFRFLRYLRRSLQAPPHDFHPPAAVIVPVKGLDDQLEKHVESLLTQDYPDYTLTFSIAEESDPAYLFLASRLRARPAASGVGPRDVKLVVAGLTDERGEKVNNLLAALRTVPADTEILVFADADARFKQDWLGSLIGPLSDPAVTVSTGFRWYLPGRTFASRLRAAWDASIATMFGDHRSNFAWGGSMAIRAGDFRRLKIAQCYWAHSVSDDYGVTRAVKDNGGWIRFEPKCLLASIGEITLHEFWNWANRQIIITRVYASRLWRLGLLSYGLFCSTLLLGLYVGWRSGSPPHRLLALGLDAAVLGLGLAKARLRESVALRLFPEEMNAIRWSGSCYWRYWPLVPWVMLVNFVTAGLTRTIEWRGTRYRLISPTALRVLSRKQQPAPPPSHLATGAPGS
ncbi:MAG TPA: glycosyltransferase [Terriglobia bacterium]|nr:glycosyltransferase [Terriglobia bacterium]